MNLVEKLAEELQRYMVDAECQKFHTHDDIFLAQKLRPIFEEFIKSVENPYGEDYEGILHHKLFEQFRETILSKLAEEKNGKENISD